jgi:hypothetical protein
MTEDHDAEERALAEVAALRDLLGPHGLGAPADAEAGAPGVDDAAVAALLARAAAEPAPGDDDALDDALDDAAEHGLGGSADDAPGDGGVPVAAPVAPRPGRRRWVLAAGIAAATVAGVAIALLPTDQVPTAVAAGSPPMLAYPVPPDELAAGTAAAPDAARETLLDLAALAADQVDPEPTGTVQHVLSQSWLPSTTTGVDGARTAVEPTVRETWLPDDGALVAAEWRGADLRQDGLLEPVDTSHDAAQVDRFPAGSSDPELAADLSLEPVVLRGQLLELAGGDVFGCGPGTADGAWCVYQGLTLLDAYVLPSALESAVLTVLADEPGVGLAGEVTDRAGRRAVGISVPGGAMDPDPVVRLLLVDAETGRLSGREEVTLSSASMDIDEPTVTTFRYEVAADRVAEVGWAGEG